MRFEFATATRIIFGQGTFGEVVPMAVEMGGRAFVVKDKALERANQLIDELCGRDIKCAGFDVTCEPTTTLVKEAVEQARRADCDLVIGIGGGSVLDTGKAIAAMLTNRGELEDYLEVVG
ncbi:MAG: iron-containing alcohol dehydrogenase, partial [Planctomycetota bacterium]